MTRPFYRLIIFNIACFAAVVWGWQLGYVQFVFANDASHMSYAIVALFLSALAKTIWNASDERPVAWLADIAEDLATLGLAGSLIGFTMMLYGADLNSADLKPLASQVLTGLGVAFLASLVGVVTALWTKWNKRILEG